MSDVIRGGNHLAEQGVKILVASLGINGKMPPQLNEAINRWYNEHGMLVVAAAGNDGKKNHMDNPAKHPLVLAAMSHNALGERSDFSDSGEEFSIIGPGEKVLSTYQKDQYQIQSGTSQAAPAIAGIIACYYELLVDKFGPITIPMIKDLSSGKLNPLS